MPNRPLVVLVEDDNDSRDMYAESLAFAGFKVATAVDADDGFALATTLHPAAVVADFRLRGGSGADLCNRLKQREDTSAIPTLLLSSSGQRRDVEQALTQGCAIVRLKPYLPESLERDLRSLIAGESLPTWPAEYNGFA